MKLPFIQPLRMPHRSGHLMRGGLIIAECVRTCADCGVTFTTPSGNTVRCADCRKKLRTLEYIKARRHALYVRAKRRKAKA